MQAILKFSDEREDVLALRRAMKSLDMACVLFELAHNTEKKLSYNEELDSYTLTAVFEEIYNLMEEFHIQIEELIE